MRTGRLCQKCDQLTHLSSLSPVHPPPHVCKCRLFLNGPHGTHHRTSALKNTLRCDSHSKSISANTIFQFFPQKSRPVSLTIFISFTFDKHPSISPALFKTIFLRHHVQNILSPRCSCQPHLGQEGCWHAQDCQPLSSFPQFFPRPP